MATKVTSSLIDYTSSSFTGNFRNRIINGNFDVWQRGTSLVSGFGDRFLADRFLTRSISSTYTTAQVALNFGELPGTTKYYHRNEVTTGSTNGRYCYLAHRIEGVRTFAGSTATISFYAKANASKNVAVEIVQNFGSGSTSGQEFTYVDTFALTTSWQKFTATVSVPSIVGFNPGTHSSFLGLHFWFDAGVEWNDRTHNLGHQSGRFDITQVQFEEGPVATPFEQRFEGTELTLCQRYYESDSVYMGYAKGNNDNSALYVPIYYKVTKRHDPVMTVVFNAGSGDFNASILSSVATLSSLDSITYAITNVSSDVGGRITYAADAEVY